MKTRAAILYKLNSPLEIHNVEIPPLRRGQVLVKILYSGVCRAQFNEMIGLKGPDRFLPHLLGHEASGIVEEVGPDVVKVKRGDYAVLSWIKGAGIEAGPTQYQNARHTINAGAVTTFSDYSVVSENRVTKISRKIPPDIASILGCAVATGSGIIHNTLNAAPGSSIAIFGVGGIGSSIILAARRKGCSQIIAVDISKTKLATAKSLGATDAVLAGPDGSSVLKTLKRIAPDGVDYSVDASGARIAMETAFEILKTTGTCVIAGNLSKDEKISLHPFELIKGKRIIGTWGGETSPEKDFRRYARDFLRGELPIGRLITHRLRLEEINRAFELLQSGGAGRIVIKMNS